MALVAMVVLILILVVNCGQLSLALKTNTFGEQGGRVSFQFTSPLRHLSNFSAILYRSTEDGYQFLMNTSDPSHRSDSEQAKRLVQPAGKNLFRLRSLTSSDSGDYVTERWKKGILKEERKYSLVVCNNQCNITMQGSFYWDVNNVSHGNTLQVYETPPEGPTTLVLDIKQPLEVLPDESWNGTLGASWSNTTVRIFNRTQMNGAIFSVLIWSGHQCCISRVRSPTSVFETCFIAPNFSKPGESLTLPCSSLTDDTEEIVWKTPGGDISLDVSVSLNVSHQEKEDMYIETSNYSLVIPSVELKHSGMYACISDYAGCQRFHDVLVCSDLEATHVRFTLGGAADLVCAAELNASRATGAFYRLHQDQEHLKPEQMKAIHENCMTKNKVHFLLTMSNLTLNDSGLYLCRVIGSTEKGRFCFDRKMYLLLKHPFGIDSAFYRVHSSLMACGLLGMICAVVSVHLRAGRGDQASQERLRRRAEPSGRPTREAEQSGGEPDDDDVNTIEDV